MNEIDLRRIDLNLLVVFDVLMAERSVTRAADRLSRSQSAVSHSLARLREQVGDPLLVKEGGRMTPSPFAEHLVEEVRSILRNVQRVLAPPRTFEPAASSASFRVALSDLVPALFPRLMAAVRRSAPNVSVDWVAMEAATMPLITEGHVDVAFVASALALPEGLGRQEAGAIPWATFARADHPAVAAWGVAQWRRWPHVVVHVGHSMQSPVVVHCGAAERNRHIAARVLHFAAVAPLLAQTDLLATLPVSVMIGTLERYGLCALPPPFPVPPMPHRLIWAERLANDPARRWIRSIVAQCFADVLQGAEGLACAHPGKATPGPSSARPREIEASLPLTVHL